MNEMSRFEFEANKAELTPGDLIFRWGRFDAPGWIFLGLPRTDYGFSHYFVTGDEDETQRARLQHLVRP